jgi:hypothetical protein
LTGNGGEVGVALLAEDLGRGRVHRDHGIAVFEHVLGGEITRPVPAGRQADHRDHAVALQHPAQAGDIIDEHGEPPWRADYAIAAGAVAGPRGTCSGRQFGTAQTQSSATVPRARSAGGCCPRKSSAACKRRHRASQVERQRQGLLGKFLAGSIHRDGQMQIGRGRCPQAVLQVDLARGRQQQIGAAHHMGDGGVRIVDHYGQLVGKQAVGTAQHKIARLGCEIALDAALDRIVETDPGLPHAQAPSASFATRRQAGPTRSRIDRGAIGRQRRIRQFTTSAGAGENQTGGLQSLQCCGIGCAAPALPHRLAVPFEAAGLQRAQYLPGCRRRTPRRIDILDAQQPLATTAACFQIRAHGSDQRAEMQRASR